MPEDLESSNLYSEVSTAVAEDDEKEQHGEEQSTSCLTPLRRPSSTSWCWKPKQVERIVVNWTKEDHLNSSGLVVLFLYITVWLGGALVVPLTVILIVCGFYITASICTTIIILCYVVPVRVNYRWRRFARSKFGRYFQESSIRLEHIPDPVADRPTIFCINPHGVFSMSWAHCYLIDELHHAYYCFSTILRLNPFLRVLTQSLGYPSNATRASMKEHLRKGHSIAIIPGGWHEATLHNPDKDRLYIKKRQGFVKYALEYGCTITPSYCFGEGQTYSNIQGCYSFRFWFNDRKILATLPWGVWWCFFLPRPVKIHTVIGSPIQLPHIPCPTRDDVNHWHQAYVDEMVELYDRYKGKFYGPDGDNRQLEIW